MNNYEKRIKYLDYLEYGTKIRNGGFIRTEKSGDTCRVHISVKGLYPTDTLSVDILLYCGAQHRKVDAMLLHYGTGNYTAIWNVHNLAGSEAVYEEWDGIEILISEHRKLVSEWHMPPAQRSPVQNELIQKETVKNEPVQNETIQTEEVSAPEIRAESVREEQRENREKTPFADLYEDKWTQLEQYFKRVRPFGDERSYLSITPGDFVVLGGKYQKLVSNSFLLHGYYNYGHVVLGRLEEGEGYQYYLGVPGIYHEREKQVAKMFGFNGFEGAMSPSAEGGFGYYMTAVEI